MTVTEMPSFTQSKTAVDNHVQITGNLEADKVKMTVSTEGAAHIMSLLTDLYSDANLAVLREYTSNAIDSHKESGQTKPIEVTLPATLSPNFIVQDFGTGMSTADIRDIYSSYGKSTKQRDFNQIGAFGLGCKSALTLTQQFTINSVKNGQKTVAIISRGEDGVGEVNIVSSTDTSEPNGVKVTIPVPNANEFTSRVRNFFYTWEAGTVLVDGKEPDSLESDGYLRSSNDMFWYALNPSLTHTSRGLRGFNVIVGGIAYPVSYSDVWSSDSSWYGNASSTYATAKAGSFYIDIPIGSVDLTPSREDLRYSPRTVKFLKELTTTVSDEVFKMSSQEIANAPTRRDALKAAIQFSAYRRSFPKAPEATWNGEKVPTSLDFDGMQIGASPSYARANTNKYQVSYISPVEALSEKTKTIFVKVADATESGRIARNAYDYMRKVSTNPEDVTVYVTQKDVESPWILETGFAKFVDYEDFLEVAREYRRDNRDTTPREKAVPITYRILTRKSVKGVDTFVLDHISPKEVSQKAIYVKSEDTGKNGNSVFRSMQSTSNGELVKHYASIFENVWNILGLDDSDQIVILDKNKTVEALEKRVKTELRYFMDLMQESYQTFQSSMSFEDRCVFSILKDNYSQLSKIFTDIARLEQVLPEIVDPDIKKLLEMRSNALVHGEKINTYASFIGLTNSRSADTPEQGKIRADICTRLETIPRRYPLLPIGNYYGVSGVDKNVEHVMLYMKAVQENLNERKS